MLPKPDTIAAMRNQYLIDSLNDEQRQAVTVCAKNLLVLAGAGSGKTRVLVHRIAWLVKTLSVSPFAILAVTFTNKAANEMRGRIEDLCDIPSYSLWVGTFHGLAHRLLRAHWQAAGLSETFQIMDSDDQYRLVRRIMRDLKLDEEKWPPKQAQWFINHNKEKGLRPSQVDTGYGDYFKETLAKVYQNYEIACTRSGLIDFSELLLRSLELLQNNPDIAKHYQQRFQHILVDEFQDTNNIQYAWLKALKGDATYMMAVGDDDQSIYSWRGAEIENMQRFLKDLAPVETIRLEQNYRSTQTILQAANAVIGHNEERLGKNLWTNGEEGERITVYAAFNERDEAFYIMNAIQHFERQGAAYKDIAILYRSNAQSRVLEERLIDLQMPYRIYGGLKFFERAEIKDALGYLRLLANRQDDSALERVINTPTRGIGETTLTSLRECAHSRGLSLWQAAEYLITHQALSARAANALNTFLQLINTAEEITKTQLLGEQTAYLLKNSGLIESYRKDKSEKGLSRAENLEELITATMQFKLENNEENLTPLTAFLAHVALETGEGQAEPNSNCVSLMTLHAAKGLEFPVVFMVGMEEDLFPHKMSLQERGLDEERRLCYVGMTRAKEKLVLTHAENRRIYGFDHRHNPSRFLSEIPEEYLYKVRPTASITRPSSVRESTAPYKQSFNQEPGLKIGKRVKHAKFGAGMIINAEGSGEHARIQVKFDQAGTKWLVASFAKLESI